MQVRQTSWQIKKTCPCCGQGNPTFIVCPNCSFLTLECEETGDTFLNPLNLEIGFTDNCPRCKQITTSDFILATSDQILDAGFTKDDYV